MDPIKLASLGRRTHVTKSGLAGVLKELRDMGELVSDPPSRQSIKRARTKSLREMLTAYGQLLVTVTILLMEPFAKYTLTYIQPAALLRWLCDTCAPFRTYLTQVWKRKPCTYEKPWRLVVYSDEILPGNQLKHVNLRKLQTVYWSILEFGMSALSLEAFWFTLTVIRSSVVGRISGGMSAVFRILMAAFHDSSIADFHEGGIQLRLDHGFEVIMMKISVMISDLAALKLVIENKGTSGTLLCTECRNVVACRTPEQIVQTAEDKRRLKLIPCTWCDDKDFVLHTDE